ncbi:MULTISPECIES: hypothetical protein [Clostridium]|uniref:hypothetical protein n=1 Tax=Clostridium TaxID=1485 RepID=UPI0021097DE4|nr:MULTISPECIES: hypothetical protein [Clostridium]MBS5506449.1 hypothetical protein [Oscillospiraceae bacterium]MCB5925096.1 hypothetical protein [bacterium 210820-DFI.5.26]MCQ5159967.1 hypothetical protein [Clostridium sp. DFI.5.61]
MKKRLGALLCALVMCLALLSPASALEEVCFTSLNNKLLPLASDTMPLWSGGVLYVPASLFDGSATNASYGVTLGVSLTQSQSSGTITLYSLSGILVFDLNSGICVDQQTGELLSGRAITRNGRIYLPLNIVVDFFGLRSSYLHTDYGYLVRIKNRDDTASNGRRSILTDEVFIDSAGNQMNLQLKEYQKSLLPVEEPETPDVTPAVPADPPGQELDPTSIPTYLAFRCQTGEALDSILTTLEKSGKSGVFFFAPEELSVHGDMVRRLLGTGHSVGILVQAGTPEGARAELEAGNRALAEQTRSCTRYVYCGEALWEGLEAEGWVCWQESLDAVPLDGEQSAASYSYGVLRQLGRAALNSAYVTLDDSRQTADVLPALLRQLNYREYVVSTPMETKL